MNDAAERNESCPDAVRPDSRSSTRTSGSHRCRAGEWDAGWPGSVRSDLDDVGTLLGEGLQTADDRLNGALVRTLSGVGKLLRPGLLLSVCHALGGSAVSGRLAAAAAVELAQVGSLIHDDLMDRAVSRRGRRTINAAEGQATALMAGDLVLARAGVLAAGAGGAAPGLLSGTLTELCLGQVLETADVGNAARSTERYLAAINSKTGSLFECACVLGADLAGADGSVSAGLSAYARGFGYAFQIVDDLLDLVGCPSCLGKPVGQDLEAGVYTLPVLIALSRNRTAVTDALTGGDLAQVRRLSIDSGGVDAAARSARAWASQSGAALEPLLDRWPRLRGVAELPHRYVTWALTSLVRAWN